VLAPGGTRVGQMPNMSYPIESHSWLPLQQFLPPRIGTRYFRQFSPHRSLNPGGVTWFRHTAARVDTRSEAPGSRAAE
jgi:hypothetical protein